MPKTVIVLSGGMDSATLLATYATLGHELFAISFDYGQRHVKELAAASTLASYYKARHEVVDLRGITKLMKGSSQTDSSVPVPHGHYAAENMKKTVVPNRNMIMLAVAGAWAVSEKADSIAFGAHAGDHTIYPDCRRPFAEAMGDAFDECDWHKVALNVPFLEMSKAEIVRLGVALGVPYWETWSCYEGGVYHCGECGTCVERREAFKLAGVNDPTHYFSCPPPLPPQDF